MEGRKRENEKANIRKEVNQKADKQENQKQAGTRKKTHTKFNCILSRFMSILMRLLPFPTLHHKPCLLYGMVFASRAVVVCMVFRNVARHARLRWGRGVGWGEIINYKRRSGYSRRMWHIVVAFKNKVVRHARNMCGVGVGWGRIIINAVVVCKKNAKRCGLCFQERGRMPRARYVWCWGGGWGGAG